MSERILSFRSRIMLTSVGLVATVLVVISASFILRHRFDLESQMQTQSHAMRDELRERGVALVTNLALVSERALASMDYSFLAEAVTATVSKGSGVTYAIVMDTTGRVLVASDANIVSQTLADKAAAFAMAQTEVSSQEVNSPTGVVTEVVSPLHVANKSWGCIRLGMSQRGLEQSLADIERRGQEQDRSSVTLVALVAAVMLTLASMLASVFARATTKPLSELMVGAERLGNGDMTVTVGASGAAEFRKLAATFNGMTRALGDRDQALQTNMRELSLARDKAEESSRVKGEFLANMSHELRTPLNAIVNVPRLIAKDFESFPVYECAACKSSFQREDDTEEEQTVCPNCKGELTLINKLFYIGDPNETTHLMKRMMQSSNRLLNLVNDLLDFSKLEAGKVQLHLDSVDVAQLLGEMRETMLLLAEDKQISLTIDPPKDTEVVNADPVKLMQVLINLVSNAIKFTPQGGSVRVTARHEGELMHFSVTDTGGGIPSDKFNVLFESFRQIDGSHTRAHQGTGLGLAISKRLLDLHMGKIWVESELGRGSTFHFQIPCDVQLPAIHPEEKAAVNVMVIDDNIDHLDLARSILQRDGITVSTIQDATRAIGQVRIEHPDCIVLDVMMPHQSGLSLLRQLKEDRDTSAIPVFVSTAYLSNRDVVERLGGKWLPKPWHEGTFAQRIRQETQGDNQSELNEETKS